MKWVLVIGSLVLSNHPFWKSCMTGWFFSHEQLKHTNRNECCISRSASSSRRTVTLGKYPQAGEAQQHLTSARGPDDGICVTGGRQKHPAMRWMLDHVSRACEMCCEECMQSSSFPKGVCFHVHSVVTKRRDEVLIPSILVRKTDSTERKVRNLHSFILLSPCSHMNLNTCFLFILTVAAPFLGVDIAVWGARL